MGRAIDRRRVFDELLRRDFHAFVKWAFRILYPGVELKDNWHLALMARHFEDICTGKRKRLLICLPPRHLKSFFGSVCFPAWLLGKNPSAKIVCISYAQDISEGFAHQTRRLMESPGYRRIFPKTRLDAHRNTKRELGTTANGHRLAASVNGKLTGLGGDVLILDDPIKADDAFSDVVREGVNEWFDNTLISRLDDPKAGRLVTIAQRLHVDDLPGRLIGRGGWDPLILPLVAQEDQTFEIGNSLITRESGNILHEEHFGEAEAEEMRRTIPSMLFEAQWNQRPVMAGGNIFKLEWLRYDEEPVDPRQCEYVFQSWDTAIQTSELNDYTVCVTFGTVGRTFHILDVYRARIDYPEQRKQIYRLRDQWKADLVIMEGSHGGLIHEQDIRKNDPPGRWINVLTPRGSKIERAEWQTAKFEQGQIRLPRTAPWRAALEQELAAFPKAPHDDQVDAIAQFLTAVDRNQLEQAVYVARHTHR